MPRFARSCQPGVVSRQNVHQTALRASMVINTSTSAKRGSKYAPFPSLQICVLGSVVHIRALPSLVTRHTEPVSATAKITAGNTYFSTEEIFADFLPNE